jgi:pilus assembly protein CpaB
MRPKSVALLLLALGCGLVASIGITKVMIKGNGEETGGEGAGVLVATADIPMGGRLTSQTVKLVKWTKDTAPPVGAISKMEEIENRRVRSKLYAGEAILENRLCGKGTNQQGATAMIPVGYRVVPVKVDLVSGGSDLILPGDRVDVMIHLVRDPPRGIDETVTRTILQDIKVFAVNDVLDLDKDKDGSKSISAKTISLLVTPEQAAKIMLATQTGVINLVMRSSEEDKTDAQVEARTSDLLGALSGSHRTNEEPQGPPAAKQDPFPAVAPLPVQTASPRTTWTVRVVKGNTVDEVMFEKDPNPDSPLDSWKVASTANVVAAAPAKEEPKIEAPPVRQPPESVQQEPKPAKKPVKQNQALKAPSVDSKTSNS